MTTAILFLRLFLAAHPAPTPARAPSPAAAPTTAPRRHVGGPAVLVLDFSGPSAAEDSNPFPAVVSKGRL